MTHFKLNEFLLRMNKKGLRFLQIFFYECPLKKAFFSIQSRSRLLLINNKTEKQNGFEQEEGPHAEPHHPVGPAGAGGAGVQHP